MYILFTHNRYFFCVDSSLDIPIFFSRCKHPRTNPIRQPLKLNRLRLCISFFFDLMPHHKEGGCCLWRHGDSSVLGLL